MVGVKRETTNRFITWLAALVSLMTLAGGVWGQEAGRALSKEQVVKLLKEGDPPVRVQYLVSKYGIAFPMTAEIEQELVQAGANPPLIETLHKLAPPSPAKTSTPMPQPAQPTPPTQPTTQPPPPPVLVVNAKPGEAEVYVDDERHGQTSPAGILKVSGLSPGSHKLRLSRADYQSFETLVELANGETNTVVASLQPVPAPVPPPKPAAPAEGAATAHPQPPPDPNDPMAAHDPGIYYVQQKPSPRRMIALEPTPLGNQMAGSMMKMAWRSSINGSQAQIRISEVRPTFYFYLPPAQTGFPGVSSAGFSAVSPSEFVLAHLEIKKNSREVPLEKARSMAGPSGVRSKDQVLFAYDKVAPGIYKIQPQTELAGGEYGFLYSGSVQMATGRVFDFGIEGAK